MAWITLSDGHLAGRVRKTLLEALRAVLEREINAR